MKGNTMKRLTLARKALADSQIKIAKQWLKNREKMQYKQNQEQCIQYAMECLDRYEEHYSPSLEEMISIGEGNLEQR
jgi:hypothetical protein|tara:strand:- start:171 stop:401 length:231 start_codon:yes stop_codon:yes gene_type:complete